MYKPILCFVSIYLTCTAPSHAQMVDAEQIRPILDATKSSWVAVREWEGEDLIYFTHLESWRCGLDQVTYSINGETATEWELAPCDESNPMAIPDGHSVYTKLPLKSVETLLIELIYDDGGTDSVEYDRASIQIQ